MASSDKTEIRIAKTLNIKYSLLTNNIEASAINNK
jgi:hypothetical protein